MSSNGQRFVTGGNINSDRQTGGHTEEVQLYSSTLGTLEDKQKSNLNLWKKKSVFIDTNVFALSPFDQTSSTDSGRGPRLSKPLILHRPLYYNVQCYRWNFTLYNN